MLIWSPVIPGKMSAVGAGSGFKDVMVDSST